MWVFCTGETLNSLKFLKNLPQAPELRQTGTKSASGFVLL